MLIYEFDDKAVSASSSKMQVRTTPDSELRPGAELCMTIQEDPAYPGAGWGSIVVTREHARKLGEALTAWADAADEKPTDTSERPAPVCFSDMDTTLLMEAGERLDRDGFPNTILELERAGVTETIIITPDQLRAMGRYIGDVLGVIVGSKHAAWTVNEEDEDSATVLLNGWWSRQEAGLALAQIADGFAGQFQGVTAVSLLNEARTAWAAMRVNDIARKKRK